jgi:excinuclease ABC subunit A
LVKRGHSVVVIEHNSEVLKYADWIIDIGPSGGKHRGKILFEGIPEDIVQSEATFTSQFLGAHLHLQV